MNPSSPLSSSSEDLEDCFLRLAFQERASESLELARLAKAYKGTHITNHKGPWEATDQMDWCKAVSTHLASPTVCNPIRSYVHRLLFECADVTGREITFKGASAVPFALMHFYCAIPGEGKDRLHETPVSAT